MRHFKAIVEYDGTDFCGFQWQKGKRSVQSVLEAALAKRMEEECKVAGAGRTDSGVHALGQVIGFSSSTRIPLERMALALNSTLPLDVTVRRVEEVSPAFHVRFSASSRVYGYLILNRRMPSALWRRYSGFCPVELNVEAMQVAANSLLGERDFAAFANDLLPKEPTMRDMMVCRVRPYREFVIVRVEANAFLRGMVRNIVGTLMDVGMGKREPDSLGELLATRDRRMAGATAPPQGLCLLQVRYGERKIYPRQQERRETEP